MARKSDRNRPWAASPDITPQQQRNRRIVKVFFLASVGLLLAVMIMPASNSDDTQSTASLTPAERLEKYVLDETGDETNLKETGGSRLRALSLNDGKVVIEMNGDENISSGLTKSTNRRLVLKAIKGLQESGATFDSAVISVYYPLIDKLGNTSVDVVLMYSFSASRIAAINPDNVDAKGMDLGFADIDTFIHPAFAW